MLCKLVKIITKSYKDRLDNLEEVCESLNQKAFDINDYSIYDPNAVEESSDNIIEQESNTDRQRVKCGQTTFKT